jgi:osmotically inducible protein OsmC
MPVTDASAVWNGSIGEGSGTMKMSGWEGQYSTPLRFQQEGEGTSPEELVAAAHAGCFSMQLSALLTRGRQGQGDVPGVEAVRRDHDHTARHAEVTGAVR